MQLRRGLVGRIPRPLYWLTRQMTPIACVDVLPRTAVDGEVKFGLIRRKDPEGVQVWALVGGGIHRGEAIEEAIERHLRETLGAAIEWRLPEARVPQLVAEYFPWEHGGDGLDPRKHAIAMTYVVDVDGEPRVSGEALAFEWFAAADIPPQAALWRGQHAVVKRLLSDR